MGRFEDIKQMNKIWHIWSDADKSFLESVVNNLEPSDTLTILSAEESYYPARTLIEKTIPLNDDQWPTSFGNYLEFCQKLKKIKNVDIILGSDDPAVVDDYALLGTVHTWSNFFLYRSCAFLNLQKIINTDYNPKKLFISLNTRAHYHRCLLMDLIVGNNLLNDGIISWHNQPADWKNSHYEWKHWSPKFLSFDTDYNVSDKNRLIYQHTLPKELNDVFLMLISETCVDHLFITEKTWHAILAEKPFIVFGSVNFHKKLESMGFELYNDVIDYSFDCENDFRKRASMIIKELQRLNNLNFVDMHRAIEPKLKKNKTRALEMVKNEEGIPKLSYSFKCYKEIIEKSKNYK